MKFKNHSHEAISELLLLLAEKETFDSLKGLREFKQEEVSDILKEIAIALKEESLTEGGGNKADLSSFELTSQALSLISSLSPREETILFKSFKLI